MFELALVLVFTCASLDALLPFVFHRRAIGTFFARRMRRRYARQSGADRE